MDRTAGLRLNLWLLRLGMGGLVKRMMSSAPPFYYYNDFTQEETDYILECLDSRGRNHEIWECGQEDGGEGRGALAGADRKDHVSVA